MKTVTSVSGGKTSAMMALEFPTDHYIFAVVLTDHQPSAPKDKGLLREAQNRIPWFIASHEADLTLLNMLRLEQELGKRIDWVASQYSLDRYLAKDTDLVGYRSNKIASKEPLDAIFEKKKMLPNAKHRFCTVEAKLVPMFWYCYINYLSLIEAWDVKTESKILVLDEPLLMNIGFRYDEPQRVDGWTCDKEKFKFPDRAWTGLSKDGKSCSLFLRERQQHTEIEWRISRFPMYEHRITRSNVASYWSSKKWEFPQYQYKNYDLGLHSKICALPHKKDKWVYPEISNCRFCFHHRDIEQQRQAELKPENLQWWLEQEEKTGHTFGKRPLKTILAQPLLDVYGDQEPCHCTD